MAAASREAQLGPKGQVFYGARYEHLTGPRERGDSRDDVDRDAGNAAADTFTFGRVDAGTQPQSNRFERGTDGPCAAGRVAGRLEAGEEAITTAVDLPTAEGFELLPDDHPVSDQEGMPIPVAQLFGDARGVHDVREQERQQQAIGFGVAKLQRLDSFACDARCAK